MNIHIKDNSPLFFIKDFLIGLFDFVMRIVMSIPFHAVRIAYLRLFIGHLGKNVSISSTSTILKFSLNEVRLSDRSTIGTKAINLKDNQYVTGMIIE